MPGSLAVEVRQQATTSENDVMSERCQRRKDGKLYFPPLAFGPAFSAPRQITRQIVRKRAAVQASCQNMQ